MPHPTTFAALPAAAPPPSPGKETTLFTNKRPGNAAAPASFDNDDVDDGRHGRTRRTRRKKRRGKFVCSSPFYPASSPSYSSFSSTRSTQLGRNRIITSTPTMSTTVGTDEQDERDERDERDEQNENVSSYILVLFIQHLLLLTFLLLLLD